MSERIVLAGGSGFLGAALANHFKVLGWEVLVLTRHPKPRADGVREIAWDGTNLGSWSAELEGAEAVVNLCGKSVDCRYTASNRKLLLESRTLPTRAIGEAIAQCKVPPRVWLNSSTATIYQHTLGPAWDESGVIKGTPEAKDEFSIQIAETWEREFTRANTPRTRKVTLRSAMVLGHGRNSVFPALRRLTRLGLGGHMGNGSQFVSWIHQEDFCRATEWLFAREHMSGVVNVAAPNPLTNADMMQMFRKQLGMPFGLPATEWMLEVGAFLLRTETELIIKSRRVVPGRLLANAFEFRFTHFADALRDLLADQKARVALEPGRPSTVAARQANEHAHRGHEPAR